MATHNDTRFGATIEDALEALDKGGYTASFRPAGPHTIVCLACRTENHPGDVSLEDLVRIEGASDPADEAIVAGLRCPACDRRGTILLTFGPAGSADDGAILPALDDQRTHV